MNIDFSVLQPTQIYDYNDPVARQIRNKYSTYKNKVRELQILTNLWMSLSQMISGIIQLPG